MKQITDIASLEFHHRQGGSSAGLRLRTLMLAIGTILHLVSPSVAGIHAELDHCDVLCRHLPDQAFVYPVPWVLALSPRWSTS